MCLITYVYEIRTQKSTSVLKYPMYVKSKSLYDNISFISLKEFSKYHAFFQLLYL